MSWGYPWVLLALSLPAAAAYLVSRTRRNLEPPWPAMSRVSVGSNGSVRAATPGKSGPAYLIIAAVALGVLALARPQWGERPGQSFSQSVEVMIALDLSRSMWARDMPNHTSRLSAAKATIGRLLDDLRGESVGLVIFAGTSLVQVPMSQDYQVIREFLPSLDPNYMPVGGSDYDRMLGSAVEGFGKTNDRDRYLIVLSDGESTEGGFMSRVPDLLRRNIHVIGIGFGTERGASILDPKGVPLLDKDQKPVISRLTPATLQSLTARTEGAYVAATTLADEAAVQKLIKGTVESGRSGRVGDTNVNVGVERFQWFLVPAVLLSLVSLAREFRRYPRPRAVRPTAGPATSSSGAAARTAAVAIGGLLTMLLFALAAPGVQAHQDAEAGFAVKAQLIGDPAERVRALASHMGRFGYDPLELKMLVEAAMQFAIGERARGRLPLQGVMRDAVDAVHVGKKLDPQMAQWDHYEVEIHELLAPLPVEVKKKDANNGQDDEDDDDEQNFRPVPLRKAKDKHGRDLFGNNADSRSEFVLGDLSGDETFAPQEPHGHRRRPPTLPQNPTLTPQATLPNDPKIVEARKNFAIVVRADSPARIHRLLNGDEKKRAVDEDW